MFEILLSAAPFRGWTGAGTAGAHHDAGLPEIHGQLGNGSCDQDAELGIFYGDSLTGAFTKLVKCVLHTLLLKKVISPVIDIT